MGLTVKTTDRKNNYVFLLPDEKCDSLRNKTIIIDDAQGQTSVEGELSRSKFFIALLQFDVRLANDFILAINNHD